MLARDLQGVRDATFLSQAKLLNPRFLQNYIEEGAIGKVTNMYRAACNGPVRETVQDTVAQKYLTGYMLRCKGFN